MKKVSLTARAGAGVAALALTAVWVAGRAWAFNPQPDPPGRSGLVGIVEGQTAQLNAVNVSNVPVRVTLNFYSGDGSVVKRSEGTLRPGQSAFLDLTRAEIERSTDGAAPAADVGTGGAGRAEVRGEVVLLPAVQRAFPPDPIRPTLEVFGADGSTSVLDTDFRSAATEHSPPSD